MVKKDSKSIAELKHRTRRLSIKEGIFRTFRQAFGDHYISPFAIAIGTSSPIVALINTLWTLSSATQIFGIKIIKKFSRKRIITTTVAINSIGFLLLALIGLLYLKGTSVEVLSLLIFLDLFIFVATMGIDHPAWFSWMGDVVDPKYRGRWWAKRSTIITFTSVILTITASFILESFKRNEMEILGFIIFFMIAFFARAYCVRILFKHYEPPIKKYKEKKFKLKDFTKELTKTNFGKFVLFRGIFSISVMITSPLVAIYLLRTLGFSYPTYIIIALSGMIFSILTLNMWGILADKFGNYRIIALSTLLIPITPILWMLSTSKLYLFLVPGIIGGIGWHGFFLASKNFVYDNVSKDKRAKAIAYVNLSIGIGSLIGGLISAALIKYLSTSWIEPIALIFIIGAVARMIVVGFFIPKMKEIKHKQKFKGLKELKHLVIKELRPTLIEDLHEIESIKNYMRE
jgi:MFS family permease